MANTTKFQDHTLQNAEIKQLSGDRELRCRPIHTSTRHLESLSLQLESIYSQLCFDSELGGWVAIEPGLEQEIDDLAAIGLVEVSA